MPSNYFSLQDEWALCGEIPQP